MRARQRLLARRAGGRRPVAELRAQDRQADDLAYRQIGGGWAAERVGLIVGCRERVGLGTRVGSGLMGHSSRRPSGVMADLYISLSVTSVLRVPEPRGAVKQEPLGVCGRANPVMWRDSLTPRRRPKSARLVWRLARRRAREGTGRHTGQRSPPAQLEGRATRRGWGTFLIQSLVDEVDVASTGTGNVLRMVVHLTPEQGPDPNARPG